MDLSFPKGGLRDFRPLPAVPFLIHPGEEKSFQKPNRENERNSGNFRLGSDRKPAIETAEMKEVPQAESAAPSFNIDSFKIVRS
jgi:hypothetical protein